ncbi:MAG: hypothetical protein ACI9QL_005283, partial [Candidatus Omnitrophota bacterium]
HELRFNFTPVSGQPGVVRLTVNTVQNLTFPMLGLNSIIRNNEIVFTHVDANTILYGGRYLNTFNFDPGATYEGHLIGGDGKKWGGSFTFPGSKTEKLRNLLTLVYEHIGIDFTEDALDDLKAIFDSGEGGGADAAFDFFLEKGLALPDILFEVNNNLSYSNIGSGVLSGGATLSSLNPFTYVNMQQMAGDGFYQGGESSTLKKTGDAFLQLLNGNIFGPAVDALQLIPKVGKYFKNTTGLSGLKENTSQASLGDVVVRSGINLVRGTDFNPFSGTADDPLAILGSGGDSLSIGDNPFSITPGFHVMVGGSGGDDYTVNSQSFGIGLFLDDLYTVGGSTGIDTFDSLLGLLTPQDTLDLSAMNEDLYFSVFKLSTNDLETVKNKVSDQGLPESIFADLEIGISIVLITSYDPVPPGKAPGVPPTFAEAWEGLGRISNPFQANIGLAIGIENFAGGNGNNTFRFYDGAEIGGGISAEGDIVIDYRGYVVGDDLNDKNAEVSQLDAAVTVGRKTITVTGKFEIEEDSLIVIGGENAEVRVAEEVSYNAGTNVTTVNIDTELENDHPVDTQVFSGKGVQVDLGYDSDRTLYEDQGPDLSQILVFLPDFLKDTFQALIPGVKFQTGSATGVDGTDGTDGGDDVIGTPVADFIAGSDIKNNIIDGADGDDFLMGKDGDDVLLGGAGSDQLFGGGGSDLLIDAGGRSVVTTATATLGLTAASFTIDGGDTTYSAAPVVDITGGGGMGWEASAILTDSLVSGILITNPGTGYTTSPVITFNGGTILANGTTLPSGLGNASQFTVSGITLGTAGSEYGSVPLVFISGGGAGAAATAAVSGSTVEAITLTHGGSGYASVPTVTVASTDRLNGGDGDDILIAGEGFDYVLGGDGKDTYVPGAAGELLVKTTGDKTPLPALGPAVDVDLLAGIEEIDLYSVSVDRAQFKDDASPDLFAYAKPKTARFLLNDNVKQTIVLNPSGMQALSSYTLYLDGNDVIDFKGYGARKVDFVSYNAETKEQVVRFYATIQARETTPAQYLLELVVHNYKSQLSPIDANFGKARPLLVDGAIGTGTTPLTTGQLEPIRAEAERRWEAITTNAPAVSDRLAEYTFEIIAFGGKELAQISDKVIYIDADAAGHGWFVDPTPMADGDTVVGFDLLTVIMHEYGHALGLEDSDAGVTTELMKSSLALNARVLLDLSSELNASLPKDPLAGNLTAGLSDQEKFVEGLTGLSEWAAGFELEVQDVLNELDLPFVGGAVDALVSDTLSSLAQTINLNFQNQISDIEDVFNEHDEVSAPELLALDALSEAPSNRLGEFQADLELLSKSWDLQLSLDTLADL